jgi:hypothetical protein
LVVPPSAFDPQNGKVPKFDAPPTRSANVYWRGVRRDAHSVSDDPRRP